MARTKISEWSSTPANNTDIDSINIAEGCAPSGINDAIRELMAQVKDLYAGTSGDIIAVGAGGTGVGTSTGSGNNVLSTSPTLVTPVLGTPTSVTLTNATGLPIATGVSGLGTGVATALAVNVGSAGAPVLFNGALGTPSSGTVTNLTGTASININGTVGATTPTTGAFTTVAASSTVTLSGGTANGVTYLNGSKVLTSGSALTFGGANLGVNCTATNFGANYRTLEVAAPQGAYILASDTTNTATIQMAAEASVGYLGMRTNHPLAFIINNTEGMRLTSSSLYTASGINVGIGLSNPAARLQVLANNALNEGGAAAVIRQGGAAGNNGLVVDVTNTVGQYIADFRIGNSSQMKLDSSGNLGLGVTPSAWYAGGNLTAMQIGGSGTALFSLFNTESRYAINYKLASGTGTDTYIANGYASYYRQSLSNGQHQWYNAPSGTAGNAISFTQAMTLDADGDLGVGTTSPSQRLQVAGNEVAAQKINAVGTNYGSGAYLNAFTSAGGNDVGFSGFIASQTSNSTNRLWMGVHSPSGSNQGFVGMPDATPLTFWTNSTERARIDSSGNLLVGTTNSNPIGSNVAGLVLSLSGNFSVSRNGAPSLDLNRYTSDGTIARFYRSASQVGSIDVTTTATSYVTSSDYRLKNTIAPMTGALAKVALLKPCTYKWNADGSNGEGFIAHELAEVVPQCVSGAKDAVDEDGNPKYQGIDTSFLVATLTAAIQELKAEFDAYKASHP